MRTRCINFSHPHLRGNRVRLAHTTVKKDIHPTYYPKASAHCACGNNFIVGSAKEFIETEVCAQCHPFYTKQEKVMDTLGRVQKFKERLVKKSTIAKRVKNPRARAEKK